MNKIDRFDGEYDFLSNFSQHVTLYRNRKFLTVEHAFQAAKSDNIADWDRFLTIKTPGLAKKEGRMLSLRPDWESVKIAIMEELVWQKFYINWDIRIKLVATDDAELIEGNSWDDTFWGVCYGKGQNMLGKILMKVRSQFKNYDLPLLEI